MKILPGRIKVRNVPYKNGTTRAFWKFWKKRTPQPTEEEDVDCNLHEECPQGYCCSQSKHKCLKTGASECSNHTRHIGKIPSKKMTHYPVMWKLKPGEIGFNEYARSLLHKAGLNRTLSCRHQDGDRWYQRTVSYLVHPLSPIQRLLVAHQLGTGKTITMLRVLDNFFDWPGETRPRVLLFPTETVAENFYRELATQPNRYRDWLQTVPGGPRWPELDRGTAPTTDRMIQLEDNRRAYVEWMREELAKWPVNVGRHKGTGMLAPLRTFSYAQAGANGGNGSLIKDSIIRWPPKTGQHGAFVERTDPNLLEGMIVLCDEAHNLLQPDNYDAEKRENVRRCKKRLYTAVDSVIVFSTATPVINGTTAIQEARQMMEMVKGSTYADQHDEGFVSWYMDRPQSLFARITPASKLIRNNRDTYHVTGKTPPTVLNKIPNVWPVPIDSIVCRDLWLNYIFERFGEGKAPYVPPKEAKNPKRKSEPPQQQMPFVRGRGHCLTEGSKCKESWTLDETMLRREAFTEELTMERAMEVAPKLAAMALSIVETPLKTLVLLHSKYGTQQLANLLVIEGVSVIFLGNTEHLKPGKQREVRAENATRLHAFNHPENKYGDRYRVVVAEAEEYSEGISFMHIRRIIIDQGYGMKVSWASMEQKIGRALRSCSHEDLPRNLRTLQVDLFIAVHSQGKQYPPTIDLEKYLHMEKEIPLIQKGMDHLRDHSIDAAYYGSAVVPSKRFTSLW